MNSNDRFKSGKTQRGAALVEFAVLLPILVILLFGFIEIGRVLYQNNQLNKAVTAGARYVARIPNAASMSDCTPDSAWTSATDQGKAMIAYTDGGTGSLLLPGLDDSGAITFDANPRDATVTTACVITVNATTQFVGLFGDSIVPLLDIGPLYLKASVEERYIGE